MLADTFKEFLSLYCNANESTQGLAVTNRKRLGGLAEMGKESEETTSGVCRIFVDATANVMLNFYLLKVVLPWNKFNKALISSQ